MAQNRPKVLLGFEDETITDKHKSLVNFMTNKIGGKPDWYLDGIPSPCCQLCGLTLPLVLQVYAPLEASPYHRTLYLFGCINPNCWNERESWVCLRSQGLETNAEQEEVSSTTTNTISATDWCCDADDWGDEDNNINNNEENGNVIGCIESCCDEDDDDDETEEYEEAIRVNLGNLSVDECNANVEGGAVGRLHSPSATAEIEGDESGVVSIDTPTAPQRDLLMLLQEAAPVPTELRNKGLPQFASAFISVDEEEETPVPEHVRDLLQEYQQHSPQHEKREDLTLEKYEKSIPAHGDKMFHYFLTRIQKHPGQIIRYCREVSSPLLLYPVQELPVRCNYCCGDVLFEMQVLPTLIPKLQLLNASEGTHLEFGTVLVFTCQRSCWTAGDTYRHEHIVLQAEKI